jgi:putative peptide zinc metalloprotease protein
VLVGTGARRPAAMTTTATWTIGELSVEPQGEDGFVVGDAATGNFVLLPAIGVDVIGWLRAGHELDRIGELAHERAGEVVDVETFLHSLEELGFVRSATEPDASPDRAGPPATHKSVDVVARALFGRVAWVAFGALAAISALVLAARPDLRPQQADIFFLSTPATSLAALTAITYLSAVMHEGAHWLAARSVGVRASITVSRRLYFLAFETDLSGLWSIPRRKRWRPLVAGMAFDAAVLGIVLLVRWAENGSASDGVARLLGAITLVEVAAIVAQFLFFLRTDVYAMVVVVSGAVDLYRTTALSVLTMTRLATRRQRAELDRAEGRDVQIARWYRWIWLAGMISASVFFVTTFVPALVETTRWLAATAWPVQPTQGAFWQAVALTALIASPEALTLAVAMRDLRRRFGARQDAAS